MKNVRVLDKQTVAEDAEIQERVSGIAAELGGEGRILLRESGTEPVIRVMVEASDKDSCERYVDEIVNLIQSKGYVTE